LTASGRGRYAAVAAVVFALGVAALAARSYRPFGAEDAAASGRAASTTFVDGMFTVLVILLLAVALLVLVLRVGAIKKGERGTGERSLKGLFAYLGFVVFLSAIGARVLHRELRVPEPGEGAETAFPDRRPGAPAEIADPVRSPEILWPLVIGVVVAIALIVIATAVIARRRRRRHTGLTAEERQELAAAIDVAIDDLRREPDPRRAVVAAYARMEQVLLLWGMPRGEAETPYEYLARAGREIEAEASMASLTELFEVAKFSEHAVDESMRARAIDALSAVRDEVRAVRA
jgi:hypothetical protein